MTLATTYQLRHPLSYTLSGSQHGETSTKTLSEVEVHRPTARHMLLFDEYQDKPMALMLAMIQALTELTSNQVKSLDPEDFFPLGELAMSFATSGQQTGETV